MTHYGHLCPKPQHDWTANGLSYIVLTRRRADLVQSIGVDRHVELVALQWL
jgi:hypothetical protein